MNLLNTLLLKLARLFAILFRKTQNIAKNRIFNDAHCLVWELPYAEPEKVKSFIKLLNLMFPKKNPFLHNLSLVVNNGKHNLYEVYVVAAFHKDKWLEVSDMVNAITGVMQTYIVSPDSLLSLAIQGHYSIATANVTEKTVDYLYKGKT